MDLLLDLRLEECFRQILVLDKVKNTEMLQITGWA